MVDGVLKVKIRSVCLRAAFLEGIDLRGANLNGAIFINNKDEIENEQLDVKIFYYKSCKTMIVYMNKGLSFGSRHY